MTFRKTTARGIGIGLSLSLLSACAEARPIADARSSGPLTTAAGGYELEVLVDGAPAPTFFQNGETYVMGALGERYTLRIINHTGRRIEAVASVDGRDVVDGRSADFRNKRGYIVPAWGSVDVDGWRLSQVQVAAFRFSSVADSYAARTGSAREVGVIGAAIFPERIVPRPRPIAPYSYYRERDSDRAPYPSDEAEGYGGRAEPPAARKPASGDASGPTPSSPPAASESTRSAPPPAPLSGGGSAPPRGYADATPSRRPGLGTEFGEAVGSSVREVSFVRANPSSPAVVLGARYNDHDGLVALGIDVDRDPYACGNSWGCDQDLELRQTASPFPVTDRRYAAPPPCWNGRTCR
jgi:hypothetical protein